PADSSRRTSRSAVAAVPPARRATVRSICSSDVPSSARSTVASAAPTPRSTTERSGLRPICTVPESRQTRASAGWICGRTTEPPRGRGRQRADPARRGNLAAAAVHSCSRVQRDGGWPLGGQTEADRTVTRVQGVRPPYGRLDKAVPPVYRVPCAFPVRTTAWRFRRFRLCDGKAVDDIGQRIFGVPCG